MTATDTFGKVTPDNRPRSSGRRRDPDEDTPAPAPAPAAVEPPVANRPTPTKPGPNDPLPQPPGPAEPDGPTRATPGALAARGSGAGGGTLASVLTAPQQTAAAGNPISEGVAALMGLAAMADRPVDPMMDWVGDGTRLPKFLAEAVRLYARLVGRKTQEVMRDAMLGTHPLPDDVLDAAWLRTYGTPREAYDPEMYR